MSTLKHLPADVAPATIASTIREDGACVIDNRMPSGLLERLRNEVAPYVEATPMGGDDFSGRRTQRTGALAARSQACRDLITDRAILAATEEFLKPYCDVFQLHLTQMITIHPGQGRQPLHRDRLAWGGFLPAELEPQLNTIWAVTDFTKENGATQVVPGSNQWDPARQAEPGEVEQAEMSAGSVLVYSGSVIHSGGENRSHSRRMGLNLTYTVGWLRQEENQYLSCPPEIARDFSPELQALLGYAMGSYALGYFSPPASPGEAPEVVPPQWLFGEENAGFGGSEMYEKISGRASEGAM